MYFVLNIFGSCVVRTAHHKQVAYIRGTSKTFSLHILPHSFAVIPLFASAVLDGLGVQLAPGHRQPFPEIPELLLLIRCCLSNYKGGTPGNYSLRMTRNVPRPSSLGNRVCCAADAARDRGVSLNVITFVICKVNLTYVDPAAPRRVADKLPTLG